MSLGASVMPIDFQYGEVFRRGRPQHRKYDDFWRKHPPMPPSKWAKIYAPFDALDGFDEAIGSREVLYCERRELGEGEKEELNRRLSVLRRLTARKNRGRSRPPAVTVTYFEPCTDECSEWFGSGGRYRDLRGRVRKIDSLVSQCIVLQTEGGERSIPLSDITCIKEEMLPDGTAPP